MIDLKLNELPIDAQGDFESDFENNSNYTEAQKAAFRARRQGLSVKDTIAGDAMNSVGARGVGTSGTESGAGAGAGLANVTPVMPGDSTVPDVTSPSDRPVDL
jgi:hypothetical protein